MQRQLECCFLGGFLGIRGTISSFFPHQPQREQCGYFFRRVLPPSLLSHSTFCRVWRNFLGHVVVCKPMSDLCATCQRNSTTIVRSVNMGEEEKSEVLSTHIEHMQSMVHIHMHACTMFSHTPTVDRTCTYM